MDFWSLQHKSDLKVHLIRQASTSAFVTPSGFDYPLDVLLPSSPSELRYGTHRALGILPFEVSASRPGYGNVSAALSPPAVSLASDMKEITPHTATQAAAPGPFTSAGNLNLGIPTYTLAQELPWGFPF